MTKQNSEQELRDILKGIDETQDDSGDGWWETSVGAGFGKKKLSEIIELLNTRPNQPDKGKEIGELRAYINDLREMLRVQTQYESRADGMITMENPYQVWELLEQTPAQSLQAYHDSIVEKCANLAAELPNPVQIEEAIRELKEQK
jgi:hypothetical protein